MLKVVLNLVILSILNHSNNGFNSIKMATKKNSYRIQMSNFESDFEILTSKVLKTTNSFKDSIFNDFNIKTNLNSDFLVVEKSFLSKWRDLSSALPPLPKELNTDISELFSYLSNWAQNVAYDVHTIPVFTFIVFIMVIGGYGQDDDAIGSPYIPGTSTYNVTKSDNFYSARPLFVFRRLLRLVRITSSFNIKLLLDWRFGNLQKNEEDRAKEALVLATQLGPTFIKLGQALSIRTDLIPKAYALELRKLQDSVPPFDTKIAESIICSELSISSLDRMFTQISNKPIASASIGQVYRAILKDGREVAVKVQRPAILDEIALDLYLLRLLTPIQTRISNAVNKLKTNQADIDVALALVDEWGRGFVAEVDYKLEAENTRKFLDAMIARKLDSAITAPKVVSEFSGSRVIVTEWMEGTRLDLDKSPDVPRLCGVAVNAYLTMLLDTGVLHCDPHLGNLLRTKDGKLCILDWGMTLEVPKDLQYSILELIAHINSEDFDAIPSDFVNLGFTPSDKIDKLQKSGISDGLSFAFRQLSKGGGPSKIRDRVKEEFKMRYGENLSDEELRKAARQEMIDKMETQLKSEGVNVNGVTDIMEEMSRRNRELFQLPPYVLYVSRAFSTLEGIGLSINPDYSILQECYPYLSSRLITDNSPRAKQALRAMLLGKDGEVFNPEKLSEMTENFSVYTSATANDGVTAGMSTSSATMYGQYGNAITSSSNNGITNNDQSHKAEIALAKVVLSPEGNFIQDLLLEGVAKTVDALVRGGVSDFVKSTPGKALKNVMKIPSIVIQNSIPEPLRPFALPWTLRYTLPYDVFTAVEDLLEKDQVDDDVLQRMSGIANMVPSTSSNLSAFTTATTAGTTASNNVDTVNKKKSLSNEEITRLVTTELTKPDSVIRTILNDPEIRDQLPTSFNTLSKKLVGSLLYRVADRLENSINKYASLDVVVSSNQSVGGVNKEEIDMSSSSVALRMAVLRTIGAITKETARSVATVLLTDPKTVTVDNNADITKKSPAQVGK